MWDFDMSVHKDDKQWFDVTEAPLYSFQQMTLEDHVHGCCAVLNSVSCFIAHHIFVDIFITIDRTVMKFGTQTEAEQIDIL